MLLHALVAIRDELKPLLQLQIQVQTVEVGGQTVELPDNDPEGAQSIQYVLTEELEVMPNLFLRNNNQVALHIRRLGDAVTDQLAVANEQPWVNQIPQDRRSQACVKLISSARKHLRVSDAEANLSGGKDSEWARYRDSQQAILHSLENTQATILQEFTRKSLEFEASSKARMQEREAELQKTYKTLEEQLLREHDERMKQLAAREGSIEAREKAFNTKEARYVARSEQQKQIEQIKEWLQGWSLTQGTRSKRYVVALAYLLGAVASALFAVWYSYENVEILRAAEADLSRVPWWQWILLSIRSIFPLAAFITFVIYFIRWSSEWARQHADEEFRNRTRVLDIGRSAWLLEAVRDAQDNQKELSPELLKELSRNLFAYSAPADVSDLHPQAVTDLIMQGLASLRVKTPDGTEVEAKRGKG